MVQPAIFNWENKLSQDACAQLSRQRENEGINDYVMFNFYKEDCKKTAEKLEKFAYDNPNLRFRYGYGVADACVIDNDSVSRYSTELTHGPEKQQLQMRNFHAVPDFSRGTLAPNTESLLINGLDTSGERECDRLTEKDFNRFVPYVDCFDKFIENAAIALPEMNSIGANSRDIVRQAMSASRAAACGPHQKQK